MPVNSVDSDVTSLLSRVTPTAKAPALDFKTVMNNAKIPNPYTPAQEAALTEKQNQAKLYAVVRDSRTGQALGCVVSNGMTVLSVNNVNDNRLINGRAAGCANLTQYVEQDIAQATGDPTEVKIYGDNNANAPTFLDYMNDMKGKVG